MKDCVEGKNRLKYEKSNEITAIPFLLDMLALEEMVVTIDALGCQTDIAQQIVESEGDYILALKDNQGQLHEDVVEMFAYFEKIGFQVVIRHLVLNFLRQETAFKAGLHAQRLRCAWDVNYRLRVLERLFSAN